MCHNTPARPSRPVGSGPADATGVHHRRQLAAVRRRHRIERGNVLPKGEGLFAFATMDDILAGFDAINSDYLRHSRAARAIAEEYFRAETVLNKVLDDMGL